MANQRILVTYTAPTSFQASESWKRIRETLLSQLPLQSMHWKPTSRPGLRTIRELDINLEPLDTLRDELTSQIPVTVLEKPLLHLYIVTCEEFDIELYKNSVKKQIKEWLTVVAQRKPQEWLILHVVRPDSRMPTGNFFQLKGSVLDKIRTDFNVDKRDRCAQLVWSVNSSDNVSPAAWADSMTKMRDGILSALDSALSARDDEVKRSESQKQIPGWNFCTFFILKESLASSFEGVGLLEDALEQYDELETCFSQVLKERNLSWFGNLISPADGDDSAPLLWISKKPYRSLILANTISVFDFRVYLLACQCALLSKMGELHEVCRKATLFLAEFGRRLREVESELPHLFIESWTFSSALSVVDTADAWAVNMALESSEIASFNAGKGDLIKLALDQLETIGIISGHLDSSYAAVAPRASIPPNRQQTSLPPQITHSELNSALTDRDIFHDLCVDITSRAIEMYNKAGRPNFALKLRGTLAAIKLHCGHKSDALDAYQSLALAYAPDWPSLHSFALSQALDIHANLGKVKDMDWIRLVVAYLDNCTASAHSISLLHQDRTVGYISSLVTNLGAVAATLESNCICAQHSSMSIEVSPTAALSGADDGAFVDVTIQNHLPCAIPAEDISVVLIGRDNEHLRFTAKTGTFQPGTTSVKLFCPTSSYGIFILDFSEIRISRLLFQWKYQGSTGNITVKNRPPLVRIPRDPRALDVGIRRPHLVELGGTPQLLLVVCSGRNHILKASIKLSCPAGVRFGYQDSSVPSDDSSYLQIEDNCLRIVNIPPNRMLHILVPHSDVTAFQVMKVTSDVEYFTASQPTVQRTLHVMRIVVTALPIAVNVQDYFRGTRLFSKFTIATTTHQHVRIRSALLTGPQGGVEGVTIKASSAQSRVITVTPSQPASFVFQLDSEHGPVQESLSLVISYRMLREEVENLIRHSVEDAVSNFSKLLPQRDALADELLNILENDATWVELYGITGELIIPSFDESQADERQECLGIVKQRLRQKTQTPSSGEWHKIVIPVDVPRMTIVAAARIAVAPKASNPSENALYAGQPIDAILSVHTSFHWGTSAGDKERKYLMQFDVEEMIKDWLVCGRKRGDFAAMDGATFAVPITLVALHHGEIALPKVAVSAVASVEGTTKGSMSLPGTETYQLHGAERVLILPRGGRTTFVLSMEN